MNLFKKRDKSEKDNTKVKTVHIGRKKLVTYILWGIFIVAFVFAVYKNFTGIDTHTVHEVEVIETEVIDTNGVESFVRSFANVYYQWGDTQESIDARQENLKSYMTESLLQLNSSTIKTENKVMSALQDFSVISISKVDDNNFDVTYTVNQKVTKTVTETVTEYVEEPEMMEVVNEETGEISYEETIVQKEVSTPVETTQDTNVASCYKVTVYVDDSGNMVISRNPTVSGSYGKSDYEPQSVEIDGSVDSDTSEEITDFLKTFFNVYPTASENELVYYVKDSVLSPIYRPYEFKALQSTQYKADGEQIIAYVTVEYYDNSVGISQYSQYELALEKGSTWLIVDSLS